MNYLVRKAINETMAALADGTLQAVDRSLVGASRDWHRGQVGTREKALKRDGKPKKHVRRLEGYSGKEPGGNPFLVPRG